MKRRDALKTLIMASGGALTLPAWAMGWKASEMAKMNTTFTDFEIEIIKSLVDVILPSDGEIGGLSVGVDQYLVGLISRCYEEEFQGNIKANLFQLDSLAQEKYDLPFMKCTKNDQKEMFLGMKLNNDENDGDFFNFIKSQTIKGFETSEEVMVNYHGYVLMPGFYDGNVNVEGN